jgi:eukaryotic-like serine/threonine-protein kinase
MFQIGTRAGDYEILDVLQSSKKEVIYRVHNLAAQRIESMKVLPEQLRRDNETLERFFREIKLHARLLHPNIVAFYQAAQLNGIPVLTMEYVGGVTLAERLSQGAIPLPQAVEFIKQILAALSHAHSHNIIHREVTPEHVVITPDGMVKLGGFGLAKAKGDVSLTQVGTTLGPVSYMSPEQVKGRGDIDHRTDLYSAAVVFYEMVSGRRPYTGASDFDIMLAHVQRDAPPVASANRALPTSLEPLFAKAMSKKPDERFQSAEVFSQALDEMMQNARLAAPVQSPARKPAAVVEMPPPEPKPATMPSSLTVARDSHRNDRICTTFLVVTILIVLFWSLSILVK